MNTVAQDGSLSVAVALMVLRRHSQFSSSDCRAYARLLEEAGGNAMRAEWELRLRQNDVVDVATAADEHFLGRLRALVEDAVLLVRRAPPVVSTTPRVILSRGVVLVRAVKEAVVVEDLGLTTGTSESEGSAFEVEPSVVAAPPREVMRVSQPTESVAYAPSVRPRAPSVFEFLERDQESEFPMQQAMSVQRRAPSVLTVSAVGKCQSVVAMAMGPVKMSVQPDAIERRGRKLYHVRRR